MTNQDKTADQLRDCREAFNAWAEDNGFATYTAHQNGYEDAATQCAWEGWRGALQTNGSPVGWGDAKTVGQLISQLRTIDPSESIRTAYFVTIGGEKRTKVSGVTLSRERVEGGFIRTGDESVSYSNVIWASQDEREHTRADSGEAVAWPKSMDDRCEWLKRFSANGFHMNIPSGVGAGDLYYLSLEIEGLKKLFTHPRAMAVDVRDAERWQALKRYVSETIGGNHLLDRLAVLDIGAWDQCIDELKAAIASREGEGK